MSQLRQRARKVKATGAAKRRNWNPSPESSHYKVYKWWQHKSGKHVPAENFCHYWRVVVIWAPLRWLAKPLLALLGLAVVGGIVTLAVMELTAVLALIVSFTVIVYLAFGLRVTGQLAKEINSEEAEDFKWRWLDRQTNTVKAALIFAALPVELGIATLLLTLVPVAAFFASLHDDYDLYRRCGRWLVGAHFSERKPLSWIRPWLGIFIALGVLSIWYETPRAVLLAIGIVGGCIGIAVLLAYLADHSEQQRREQRRQERLAQEERWYAGRRAATMLVLRRLFSILHPKWVGNEARFQYWLRRYERYCRMYWESDPYVVPLLAHLGHATIRYYRLFGNYDAALEEIAPTAVEVRKPSKLRRFITGVGDFFVLLWSVVLAKKWKICPLVELPE